MLVRDKCLLAFLLLLLQLEALDNFVFNDVIS